MIKIRKVQLSDLEGVSEVNLSAFGNHTYPYTLRQYFDLFQETYCVALSGSKIVGFSIGALRPNSNEGWILDMGVAREFQGAGIGNSLITEVLSLLQEQQAQKISLTVAKENSNAIRLYEKYGFEQTRFECDYYGPGKDRIVMTLSL